jgi:capsular polysaccharide biosynthesis protein
MSEAVPTGLYITLRDWIGKSVSMRLRDHRLSQIPYPAQPFMLTEPKTVGAPHPVFRQRALSIPEACVAVMPDGRYWGGGDGSGAVIAPDNKLVWDVSMQFQITGWIHPVFKRANLPNAVYTSETVAVLTFVWSRNYFHWMIDVLARIDLLRRSGLHIDKYIITNDGASRFQEETLALLGIPREKVIRSYEGLHLKAARLVVPSLQPYWLEPFIANPLPKWGTDFLREQLMKTVNPQPLSGYERIYISRGDAKHRKVLNEQEVTRVLASREFRVVSLATMPVADQVRLFASAECIIAPHGASLTNLMFCRPGTQVVDIYPTRYMYPCFWHLSSYYGLRYFYLIGHGNRLSESEGIGKVGYVHDNITVDLGALSDMLRLLGV